MTILKVSQRSPVAPVSSPARMRCPVLEIGRNSVTPSTTPRISAFSRSLIALLAPFDSSPETCAGIEYPIVQRAFPRRSTGRYVRAVNKEVPVSELEFGMYIAELDRPWTDTPFLFQGFVLTSQAQLDTLRKYCKTVFVDVERTPPSPAKPPPRTSYPERASVEQEFRPARKAYKASRSLVREVLGAARIGRTLEARTVVAAVNEMTESVLRNPDALLLFSRLRDKGEYTESQDRKSTRLNSSHPCISYAGSCLKRMSIKIFTF